MYIYQNELDKPWFQHDTANGDFRDLLQILQDIAFNIAKNPKYNGYRRELTFSYLQVFMIKRILVQAKEQKLILITKNQLLENTKNRISYQKIRKTESTLIFHRQYLGC